MRVFIAVICLMLLYGCATTEKQHSKRFLKYAKVYSHNVLKTVKMPDDFNRDSDECYQRADSGTSAVEGESHGAWLMKFYNECMEERGWRE
jgi:hypothetical protein